jgi:hypothetical protein
MKWTVWLFFAVLLALMSWMLADLFDWEPFRDKSGPEYVNYKIIWVYIPKPKPWFEWMQ